MRIASCFLTLEHKNKKMRLAHLLQPHLHDEFRLRVSDVASEMGGGRY
jgi:hypothetical protein